jgi:hypothetical protein
MVRAERLFEGGHRPLEKPLGVGVTALSHINSGQIVQACATSGWSGPKAFSVTAIDRLSSRLASA